MRRWGGVAAVLAALALPGGATAADSAAGGTFPLPAAQAFGDRGFHYVVVVSGRVVRGGSRITLTLRDVSRPGQRCTSEHPLSGCATVDWSDDPSRPGTPASGVFRNTIRIGGRTLFLRESGALAVRPDAFTPG